MQLTGELRVSKTLREDDLGCKYDASRADSCGSGV